MDIQLEIEKMKFHISELIGAVDYKSYPITHLVISFNLSEADLDNLHNLFDKYDKILSENPKQDISSIKSEFESMFNLGYQDFKHVILAFYRDEKWINVCQCYAKNNRCSEFDYAIGYE